MKRIKTSRTKNKVYVCRICGQNYKPEKKPKCRHDYILMDKNLPISL